MSKNYPIATLHEDVVPPQLAKPANFRRKSNILSIAICALVLPGLLATVALPAYGAVTTSTDPAQESATLASDATDKAQQLHVDATAATVDLTRASFGVIAPPVAPVIRAASVGRALMVNPGLPPFPLGSVVGVAEQYLGVPYVFGGESPAGFDCSGFVAYVYRQFGISLPHSAAEQGHIGTAIARSAAVPGDVVVMDGGSHVGIYLGGGRMIDAPEPGRSVSVDAIYDNNYYIVRFGI